MANPFLAEIRCFPFNFAPKGWAFCDGQLLSISQNTALFSLLGTTYGGDGKSNFALPNLQGSIPIHMGQGPGLSLYSLGQAGGSDTVTLLASEMPLHNHSMQSNALNTGQVNVAAGDFPGKAITNPGSGPVATIIYNTSAPDVQLNPAVVSVAGGSQPHNNDMPTLVMNFCIALQGVYPPRT
jgi:microcystin-dependent protein